MLLPLTEVKHSYNHILSFGTYFIANEIYLSLFQRLGGKDQWPTQLAQELKVESCVTTVRRGNLNNSNNMESPEPHIQMC